jgi:hypothetical protein
MMMGIRAISPARGQMPPPGPIWSDADRAGTESRMDCETAVYLRCHLGSDFETATSWEALGERLAAKGFRLEFRDDRLSLVHAVTGVALCTCRFLGYGLAEMVARLGKPHVDAASGRIIAGR